MRLLPCSNGQNALVFLLVLPFVTSASPPVSVKLQASWNSPQLPLEILFTSPSSSLIGRETAAVENQTIFWPLLDSLTRDESSVRETEKEYYERVVQKLREEFRMDSVTLSSFKLGLSVHSAAPKLEAYYHFYATTVVPALGENHGDTCDNWAYFRGERICSAQDVRNAIKGSTGDQQYLLAVTLLMTRSIKELPFDHVYNPSSRAETVVLYADILSANFNEFHSALKTLADEGAIRYILRYRPATGISTDRPLEGKPLFLSGYGVELMLKKTDYIVIDDREVEGLSNGFHVNNRFRFRAHPVGKRLV
jgi:UDP-glucose:glycoprotein glucosyltransferase